MVSEHRFICDPFRVDWCVSRKVGIFFSYFCMRRPNFLSTTASDTVYSPWTNLLYMCRFMCGISIFGTVLHVSFWASSRLFWIQLSCTTSWSLILWWRIHFIYLFFPKVKPCNSLIQMILIYFISLFHSFSFYLLNRETWTENEGDSTNISWIYIYIAWYPISHIILSLPATTNNRPGWNQ